MPNFHQLHIGSRLQISFQRTLRIPDDDREYPLPPGLGAFSVYRAKLFPQAPEDWRRSDDLFLSMYEREALWIGMHGASWRPDALLVGLGNINAVSGLPWRLSLSDSPMNYLVCPPQPWLDGINAGQGRIRQFVAMPIGTQFTVEGQLHEGQEAGGLRLAMFEAKPGKFPDEPPPPSRKPVVAMGASAPMGLAAGGMMKQKIYPDPYGPTTWNFKPAVVLRIHILNSAYFQAVTGMPAPATPVDAKAYTDAGLPWFDLYDTGQRTLPLPEQFAKVRSIAELEGSPDGASIEVPENQIWQLR